MVGEEKRATRFRERPRKYTGQIRDLVRDVAALFYLFVGVNAAFTNEKRALYLLVALLFSSYWELAARGKRRPELPAPIDIEAAKGEARE